AVINFCRLQSLALYYGRYGSRMRVSFPYLEPFLIGIPTKGKTVQTSDGVQQAHKLPAAVSAGASLAVQFAPDVEHLALCFAPASLAEKLAALIGDTPSAPLRFDPAADTSGLDTNSFRRLILHVVHEIDSADLEKSPVALTELEQSLMIGYLCANQSNYS